MEERGRLKTQFTPPDSLIRSNWPFLLISSSNETIPVGQKQFVTPESASWKIQQKEHEDYERDQVDKYAEYFKGNEILPNPEIAKSIEPRILSLVITDLKTRRVARLKKEAFEEPLRTAGIPCQYSCRQSFTTWDILLPTEEHVARTVATNITTKFF